MSDAHEHSDVNVRGVAAFAVGLAAVVAVVCLALTWMLSVLLAREGREKRSQYPLAAGASGKLPASPRLEGLESDTESAALRADAEEKVLGSYGPVKGKPGAAHIPIDEAMRLLAEESKGNKGEATRERPGIRIFGTYGDSNSGRTLPEAHR